MDHSWAKCGGNNTTKQPRAKSYTITHAIVSISYMNYTTEGVFSAHVIIFWCYLSKNFLFPMFFPCPPFYTKRCRNFICVIERGWSSFRKQPLQLSRDSEALICSLLALLYVIEEKKQRKKIVKNRNCIQWATIYMIWYGLSKQTMPIKIIMGIIRIWRLIIKRWSRR